MQRRSVEAPAEITDDELLTKLTHANGETKNSKAIRTLIASYNPSDRVYTAREIVQAKRRQFLADLLQIPKIEVVGASFPEHSPLGASSAERWMSCPGGNVC